MDSKCYCHASWDRNVGSNAVKTVIIWDQVGISAIQFAVVDGDYSHLDGVYNNGYHDDKTLDDLLNVVYREDRATFKVELTGKFPVSEVKDGAKVIVAGFLP